MPGRVMYDSVSVPDLPGGAPLYAGYIDGEYANFTQLRARFPLSTLVPISVKWTSSAGTVLDVEKGDATPQLAPVWVARRRTQGVDPTVYCSQDAWATVRYEFLRAGVPTPHYWIAAYPGTGPNVPQGAVAHQYASNAQFDTSVVVDYWPGVDPKPQPPLTQEELMGASVAVAPNGAVHIAAVGKGNARTTHLLHVTVPPSGGTASIIDLTDQVEAIPGSGAPYTVAP